VAALAGLLILLATAAAPQAEPTAGIHPFWRRMFARPALPGAALQPAPLVELGRRLFHDPRLSGNGRRSCATCHDPQRGFADGRDKALALWGGELRHNTPSLWNVAASKQLFWDGRAKSLEEQARVPIEAADEMAGDWPRIIALLGEDGEITALAARSAPDAPALDAALVLRALAAFERTLVSPVTRFDRWIAGEASALTPSEINGFGIFTGKGGCARCHSGWRFTDDELHDIGLPMRRRSGEARLDRFATQRFKTPSLRELSATAPYMHDGSKATLQDVVRHYAGGLQKRAAVSPNIKRDLRLDARERADLVAFLLTLSSEVAGR
jgi:cytochrome c peroxidase